jgi:Flp pilus assembly protein TadG
MMRTSRMGNQIDGGPSRWQRARSRLRREDGQSMVEFALVAPLLLLILTAILQFGSMYFKEITLTDAVRTGARTLALGRGLSDPCDPAVTQTVNSATGTPLTSSEVTTSFSGTNSGTDTCGTGSYPSRTSGNESQGDTATVSASFPYTFTVAGMPLFSVTLSASAADEIE